MRKVRITIGSVEVKARLLDTPTADAVWAVGEPGANADDPLESVTQEAGVGADPEHNDHR